MRTIRILIIFCLLASRPSCLRGEVPPALDSADERAIELALRGIKMTTHDSTFQKTNVESELVLQKTRTFLQQPLALPAYGQSVASKLGAITSLEALARFSQDQLAVEPAPPAIPVAPVKVDPDFLTNLPP